MSYDEIIESSVAAEFQAVCSERPYSRLPKGHPVYLYGVIERRGDTWNHTVFAHFLQKPRTQRR
jgi:hypothetical protein